MKVDWHVRVYKGHRMTHEFVLEGLTESEARREAENDVDVKWADDWTMVEIKKDPFRSATNES